MRTAQQRFRITVAVVAVCSLLPLAYSVFQQSGRRQAQSATPTVKAGDAGQGSGPHELGRTYR